VWRPEGSRRLGRRRRRLVDKVNMDLALIGWGGVEWIGLAQNRDHCRNLMNAVMNILIP
jgi:hypothetical protein